ncbi:type II secretion system protein J [Planococcus sp. X10-3]|uniref:PulJ/GspJ family protein n=1 Tax=Planococcus sp. X10-3 TaxID=3061240 RepID=UPI003BB1A081
MKKCWNSNEKGLTLVEVLAALVILGILFVGIMTIFPQMTLFNEKTEAKLDTMNLARQEMAVITAQDNWNRQLVTGIDTASSVLPDFLPPSEIVGVMVDPSLDYTEESDNGVYKRFRKIDGYLYEADIYLVCEEFLNPEMIGEEAPPPDSCEKADSIKLYKVHLKLYQEKTPGSNTYRLSSETFSYLSYKTIKEAAPVSGGG